MCDKPRRRVAAQHDATRRFDAIVARRTRLVTRVLARERRRAFKDDLPLQQFNARALTSERAERHLHAIELDFLRLILYLDVLRDMI